MSDYKVFILILLEVGSFMLMWNLFNKAKDSRLLKSVLIVLFTSLVVLITNYIYPPIQFLANYLFLFLAIKIAFHRNIKYLLLEFGLVLVVSAIVQLVVIILLRLLTPGLLEKNEFAFLLLANMICMLISFCIFRYTPYKRLVIFYKQESARIYLLSINLLIYILIAKWIWNFRRDSFMDGITLYLIIPAAFILVNVVYLDIHLKRNDLKKSLEDYRKYSPVISGLLEDVRRRQHDFKNHLNTIYSLVLVSDEKHLKETITQYMDTLSHSLEDMERVLLIDNTVVTAILYNKINEAAKRRIEFRYTVDKDYRLPYKDHELSEILNNLLDNAFDAVMDSRIEIKKVFLRMGSLEDGCVMEVGNSGQRIGLNDISRIFEAGFTTKKGENRGYGLCNVKKTVESYGGRIQLSFENNFTIFSVRL
jgi:signal transduction histidine kinase